MSKKRKNREKRKARSTAATAKRRAETHKTGFENTAFEVPDDKKQFIIKTDKALRLDIIPYEVGKGNPYADEGELHYERTYYVHRGIGVDSTSYICLNKTCGEACPICEFRAKLMKDPDADEDLIRDLAPKERQLFNVIDTKEKNKGVQIWDMSFHLFGKRLDAEIKNSDDDDGYENFAELEGGFILKCGVEEKSFSGRNFYEIVSINFKPRESDYDEDILSEVTCLDDILIIKDYDELKEIFLQTVSGDEDDEDEKSKSKKSTVSGKSKKVDDDDDDDTDDDDDDTDDDDDDTDDDDDDTDDDDDDTDDDDDDTDDEDKKPKSKKSKKSEKSVNSKSKPKPQSKLKSKKSKKNVSKKNRCPGGGTFGKDTDELPECNDCPIWDECDDAN